MQATMAAHYLGVSVSKFRTLEIPRKQFDGNVVWERADLDHYAEKIPYVGKSGESECIEADRAFA